MKKAKLFPNGRSQAVRLPKEFRFAGTEVFIERRGEEVVLRPVHAALEATAAYTTLGGIARYFREHGPVSEDFAKAIRDARKRDRDLPGREFNW